MKRVVSILLINICLILLFSACKKPPEDPGTVTPPPEIPEETTQPEDAFSVVSRAENRIISSDDGKKLISIDLSLPSLEGDSEAVINFNSYYDNVIEKYITYAEYDLKPTAIEQMQINADQGFEFNAYSLACDYAVTLNSENYLSISREFEYYTGGAHPGVTLKGETFQMSNGGLMNLSDLFSVPEETYLEAIYNEVIAQIESPDATMDKSNYFENYRELVKTTFDPADYFISSDGITVFYQLYSIAPYAAGPQYYAIPFEKFNGMLKIQIPES